jgi:Na+-driven multidrug efflux pump
MMDIGTIVIGQTVWLAVSFVAGVVVATTTNVAGAFGREQRTTVDWLVWLGMATGTFFVVGTCLYWMVRAGWALHTGTLLIPGAG